MDDQVVETDLAAQVEALKREVRSKDLQLQAAAEQREEFKRQVGTAAAKGKAQHGWCTEIDHIMDELGVSMPTLRKRAVIEVSLPFVSRPEQADGDHDDDWWRQSVQVRSTSSPNGNGDAYLVYLDTDHEDVETAEGDPSVGMADVYDYDDD